MTTFLTELTYRTCMQLLPNNAPAAFKNFLGNLNLSPDDRDLLDLIYCIKESWRSPAGRRSSTDVMYELDRYILPLIKQVRTIAKAHPNEDVIVISKSQRLIFFCRNGKIVIDRTDNVALGKNPVDDGPKTSMGDKRTPEGEYTISAKRHGLSKFDFFMALNYPTPEQKAKGFTGGNLGIHGLPKGKVYPTNVSSTDEDWTLGCIALEEHMAQKYYDNIRVGTKVVILH